LAIFAALREQKKFHAKALRPQRLITNYRIQKYHAQRPLIIINFPIHSITRPGFPGNL